MTTYFVVEISGKVIYGTPSWDDNGRHVQERVTMKTDTTYHYVCGDFMLTVKR